MSKYNSVQQAEVIVNNMSSFSSPVCIGLDASRFDQHVSCQALEFEHSLYKNLFPNYRQFHKLLSWQKHNTGSAFGSDGKFKYKKRGSRMSGDMNTSLGNKILMCLMAKAYIDTKPFGIEFVNNGDDCLIFLEKSNLKNVSDLTSYFLAFGFKIVLEPPVYEIEHIEFCQCKPLFCNGIWRMVRNVKTCLLKDVTSVQLGHDVNAYQKWLGGIAECGKTFAGDSPVFCAFYRMLKRFSVDGRLSHTTNSNFDCYRVLSKSVHIPYTQPDDNGRYSFWLQTGIHPDAQIEIEKYFDSSVWGGEKRQLSLNYHTIIKHGS
jgi:hypothetical protein